MALKCVSCGGESTRKCPEVIDGKVCSEPLCTTCSHALYYLQGAEGTLHDHVTAEGREKMINLHNELYKKRA